MNKDTHFKINMHTDIVIVGCGAAGLFCALNLPSNKRILIITKDEIENSDSFLAQGGICVLKNDDDYDSYFEDTLRAGHYENNREAVDIMIRSSQDIINDLIHYGVDFEKHDGKLVYTREGAHSTPRILFHEDTTGKEITSHLLAEVKKLDNVNIIDHMTMLDIVCNDNTCSGIICKNSSDQIITIAANYTVWACGGIGGLYSSSTNFPHLTGDALGISLKHNIALENIDYIQIHPTTLYSTKPGRRFLISESVRGEGAILLNKDGNRFVDELLPRDVVTAEIYKQMELDDAPNVWLSMSPLSIDTIKNHFPNIYQYCLNEGYDITKEPIPVVPSQHYFMGGVAVDHFSHTSMEQLYAIGETSCNGIHGANRLASNSLLESLVFAKRAANNIVEDYDNSKIHKESFNLIDYSEYNDYNKLKSTYKNNILQEIERMKTYHEHYNNEVKC